MSLRLVLVLVTLFALVAMANAQPDGNGYGGMDWDWDPPFDLFGDMFANHIWDRLVSVACQSLPQAASPNTVQTNSPSPPCVSPPQPTQPLANHERDASSVFGDAPPAQETETALPLPLRRAPTYAAVVQRGITPPPLPPPQQQPMAMAAGMPQQPAANYFGHDRQPAQHAPGDHFPDATMAGPSRTSTRTYADAVRSPPAVSGQWNNNAGAWMGNGNMDALTLDGIPIQHQRDLLPRDVTSNPSYHSGMTDNVPTVQGWILQARTVRDRLAPLDTDLLSPPTPSTQLSPASVTSPSSSRLSTRRNKQQMRAGHHPYRCKHCDAGFNNHADLTHHMRNHTPDEKRQHRCADCGRRFVFGKDLRRHELTHAPRTIFCQFKWCKHSTKGFRRPDHYERHLRSQHADSVLQASQPPSLPSH